MNECANKMLANPQNYSLHNHYSLETMNERKCCTFAKKKKIFNKFTIKISIYCSSIEQEKRKGNEKTIGRMCVNGK